MKTDYILHILPIKEKQTDGLMVVQPFPLTGFRCKANPFILLNQTVRVISKNYKI